MILTIHQPAYLPWLGLFHKIALADLFCYFDTVQYETNSFDNRNKIKTHTGGLWLSVPVESKDHFKKGIGEIRISGRGWQRKHLRSIQFAYQKAPFFKNYFGGLEELLAGQDYTTLSALNLDMLRYLMGALAITTPIVKASDYMFSGTKSDLVLDICRQFKANMHIFGAQGQNYVDADKFRAQGVEPVFQNYRHPVYRQQHGPFLPYMSVIDLLFNEGPASRTILLGNNVARDDLLVPAGR